MWRPALAALCLAGCTSLFGSISRGEVEHIETAITMPAGAAPLESYARFYALDGHLIRAEFVTESIVQPVLDNRAIVRQMAPRVYIVTQDNLPMVLDGGCSVVTLTYERDTGVIEGPFCNGVA